MNNGIEVVKGRLMAMQAFAWVIAETLPATQAERAANLLSLATEQLNARMLAEPLSDEAAAAFQNEASMLAAVLQKPRA